MLKNKKLIKNYVLLFLIFVLVFFAVLYISKWYSVYRDYKLEIPVIRDTLSYEITAQDLDHYIMENPNTVVYMCTASSNSCRTFEKEFKKYVEKENLQNKIVYLNLSNSDVDTFVSDFNNKYNYKIKLTENYPALVEFTDGRVTGLIEGNEKEELTVSKVDDFITINHIKSDE